MVARCQAQIGNRLQHACLVSGPCATAGEQQADGTGAAVRVCRWRHEAER